MATRTEKRLILPQKKKEDLEILKLYHILSD